MAGVYLRCEVAALLIVQIYLAISPYFDASGNLLRAEVPRQGCRRMAEVSEMGAPVRLKYEGGHPPIVIKYQGGVLCSHQISRRRNPLMADIPGLRFPAQVKYQGGLISYGHIPG